MARKVFVVCYYNEWDNPIELYRGTEAQCGEWFENNIDQCEEVDAYINEVYALDRAYDFNHRVQYYDAPMYYE